MDRQEGMQVSARITAAVAARSESGDRGKGMSRRRALEYGLSGLVCASGGAAALYYVSNRVQAAVAGAEIFPGDAPSDKLWKLWKQRGWAREARHYLKLGRNVQCKLCPNDCLLAPGDRSRCRGRVNKDGTLYTMSYGNPCSFHVDPIEKKPLFHFIPSTGVFSIATTGCGFRCLNCQNWEISQAKPEEAKNPQGDSVRLRPRTLHAIGRGDLGRLSMFPEDVVALADYFDCPSIAYTYSEPSVWFEYMIDTAQAARAAGLKSVWVTCGYIQPEPLEELCQYLDAANVDLKSFDESIYKELNSGKLEPILSTLKTLKRRGVWFEVTNLIVPTYTDQPDMIRRMCDWLLDNLGPDYPLHFSRFHPQHKLTHLPPTPIDVLAEAREIARRAGLRYVYVGNAVGQLDEAETTFCPHCRKTVVQRYGYTVLAADVAGGKCRHCGTPIAGVWDTKA